MLNSAAADIVKDGKECEAVSGHTGQIRDDLYHSVSGRCRNAGVCSIIVEDVAAEAVALPPLQSDAGLSLCNCPKLRWIKRS